MRTIELISGRVDGALVEDGGQLLQECLGGSCGGRENVPLNHLNHLQDTATPSNHRESSDPPLPTNQDNCEKLGINK